MAVELEELFVRQVDVGVADLDFANDEEVGTARVVVERATASDRRTGEERQLLLVYGAEETKAVAEALRRASELATGDGSPH